MIRIQAEDFSVDNVIRSLSRPGIGAVVTFTGMARDTSRDGAEVISIEWDVYESMAEKILAGIRDQAIRDFGIVDAAIVHRKGIQYPGENLVLIAAAGAHRREAFKACEYIMDEIKKQAPLWKKERLANGEERWIEG